MEYLLSKLIEHLQTYFPEAMLIDEDYGQLENLDNSQQDMYPLVYPAVLIEPSRVDWTSIQGNNQKGEATLRVRLIVDCYDDTHAGSDTTYRIVEREEMRARLHSLLQGYRPTEDGALMRTQSTFFTFNHGIKVYESIYTCSVTELMPKRGRVDKGTRLRPLLEMGRL